MSFFDKVDAWKLYCEAFRALWPNSEKVSDAVSPAALQEMVDRLSARSAGVRRCTCYVLPHTDDCEIFVGITQSGERVIERRSGVDRRMPPPSGVITETMVEAAAQRMVALVTGRIIEKPQLVQWQQWAGSARSILEAALVESNTPSARERVSYDGRGEVPVLVDRNDVIEQCAEICDRAASKWHADYKVGHGEHRASTHREGMSDAADMLSNEIRALKANASDRKAP